MQKLESIQRSIYIHAFTALSRHRMLSVYDFGVMKAQIKMVKGHCAFFDTHDCHYHR